MRYYRFVIEGAFFRLPDDARKLHGFVSTFHVCSEDVMSAIPRIEILVEERITANAVERNHGLFLESFCSVSDVWEVDQAAFKKHEGKDAGFTFFQIRSRDAIALAARRISLRFRRSNFLLARPIASPM